MKRFCLGVLLCSAAAWPQIPDSLNPYVRKPREGATSLEIGGNSLASMVGIKASLFVKPQVAVDLGLGVGMTGLRPGVYARYLVSKAKLSPFVYGGLKYAFGIGPFETEDTETGEAYTIDIDPALFADAGIGIDYLADFGLYFTAGFGWSRLLTGGNLGYPSGTPSKQDHEANRFITGSGPGIFLSLGWGWL